MSHRSHTHAVLVYAPKYDDPDLPALPAAAANASDLAALLSDPALVGLPADNVHLLYATDPVKVAEQLADVADRAQEAFLVYYAGHGLLGPNNKLYLATTNTTRRRVEFNGLNYEWVRHAILSSPARIRVIIVDCCFSGRAIGAMSDTVSTLAGQLDVAGTYVMTSTGPNDPASSPPGARNTAFTDELLDVLRSGIPDAGSEITLKQVYEQVERNLRAKGLPHPDTDVYRSADQMMFVHNAYIPPPAPRVHGAKPPKPAAGPATELAAGKPAHSMPWWRRLPRRVRISGVATVTVIALVIGAVAWSASKRVPAPPAADRTKAEKPQFVGILPGSGDIRSVAFSPDGRLIAAGGGNDHSVLVWDAATGMQVRILAANEVVSAVAFSADSRLVATDGVLFNPTTGERVHDLANGGYDVAFSADGRFLATASGYDPSLGVRLFNPSTGQLRRVITTEYADSLAFSPDGRFLASTTGYLNRGVRLWDPETGKLIRTLPESLQVRFSPDSRFLAASMGETVRLYDLATGERVRDIGVGKVLSFSHDGILLTVGDDKALRLYSSATGNPVRTLNVFANAAALSPDGRRIVVASPDMTVRVIDVAGNH
ncbi:MAG TPA: caspase family protein [Mycobacteriales bacterium]|nr:caspase family protein [Mycobacteriales bacterium]